MTTVATERPAEPWSAMPGWGIFADLMPPELLALRQLKGLRKTLLIVLLVVVLACAGGYGYAMHQHSTASAAYDRAQAQTVALTAQQGKYADVTQLRSTTAGIRTQIASAMVNDVDFAAFLGQVRAALPGSLSLTSITMTVNPGGSTTGAGGAASLATTAANRIGTVSLTGGGQTLADLSGFVTALAALPGVVDVLPTSNTAAASATTFTVSFGVTDALYTHRYAVKAGGN